MKALNCLQIIFRFYDENFQSEYLNDLIIRNGESHISLERLSEIAEKIGFRTNFATVPLDRLLRDVPLPCIMWIGNEPYVLSKHRAFGKSHNFEVTTHKNESLSYKKSSFLKKHNGSKNENLVRVLLVEPTINYIQKKKGKRLSWGLIVQYLHRSKSQIWKILLLMTIASLIQFIFPFLTQSIVDIGIRDKDLNFITLVLAGQLMLIISRSVFDFFRSHLLLRLSMAINLSLSADFWIKLTQLPINYFDRKHTGDVMQRIQDNNFVQTFLTGPALNTIFFTLNFIVYSVVLMLYDYELLIVFAIGMAGYILWIRLFFKLNRRLNYKIFHKSSEENNSTIQLVQGMQEIKLQNIEREKRWEWQEIQKEIFNLRFKNLKYMQLQEKGAQLINNGKDVVLTFLVARAVLHGSLTFGSMLAIQYIIGHLSGIVDEFIRFIQHSQNAKISLERVADVHRMENEELPKTEYSSKLPHNRTISIRNLTFAYENNDTYNVIDNLSIDIPENKITAIVGESGSGKTTLLKILLRFFEIYKGEIYIDDINLKNYSPSFWRGQCSAVLQDGYIFNDTIANNIALRANNVDIDKLHNACEVAHIDSFIDSLPNGLQTRLGANGVDISQGQKQRLLIARAIYKNAGFLLFDESTNALDSSTEKIINKNIATVFKDRTVLIVAHRLSTVVNADNIIVLDKGTILEQGTHADLLKAKGKYYQLVNSQMHLSS